MRKNILFFVLAIVLSIAASSYVGDIYDIFDKQIGGWLISDDDSRTFAGFLLCYLFFIPFIFGLINKKIKTIILTISPVFILFIGYKIEMTYIPILLSIAGFILGLIIRKVIHKNSITH